MTFAYNTDMKLTGLSQPPRPGHRRNDRAMLVRARWLDLWGWIASLWLLWRAAPALPVESAAVPAEASNGRTSLATLLSAHVLRDGELVLLILKPSIWYIPLSSLRFATAVLILAIFARLTSDQHVIGYIEATIFLIAGRIVWATLQWMGRLYLLTDLRVVSLTGVFNVEIFDCPLRKIARTRLLYTMRERLVRKASLEIIPADECTPVGLWQTISKPRKVQREVIAAIRRAKHTGLGIYAA